MDMQSHLNIRDKAVAAAYVGDKGMEQHHTVRQMQFLAAVQVASNLDHGYRES